MNPRIAELVTKMTELKRQFEQAVAEELEAKGREFRYAIEHGKIAFTSEARTLHRKVRQSIPAFLWETPIGTLLVAPVIYSLIIPLVLLDVSFWLFQTICFPVYGIAKVDRSRYVFMDRGQLPYLNAIERLNCNYCSYANGLVAYAREIAARTEQYFCPIKEARRRLGAHSRYEEFLDFGDAEGYRKELLPLRSKLKP
jgi:hypothetical protein